MQQRTPHGQAPAAFQRPRRRIRLDASRYGLSRTTFGILALLVAGICAITAAIHFTGNVRQRLAAAALDGLMVQADTLHALLTTSSPIGPLVALGPLPREEIEVASAPTNAPPEGTVFDRARVERLFAAALEGSDTVVRLYGVGGKRLTDSRIALSADSDVAAAPLAPLAPLSVAPATPEATLEEEGAARLAPGAGDTAPAVAAAQVPPEVRRALDGIRSAERRTLEGGDVTVFLGAPVLSDDGEVVAALHLWSGARSLNALADAYERQLLIVAVVAIVVTVVTTLVVAARVARPVARLVRAAERVKRGGQFTPLTGLRPASPLGRLNQVLADMTEGLFNRIGAIESFAGEVAHELKNPLTSLRSAVETLPLAKKAAARDRLLAIIDHDVRRIDRLISDISEASKLDAELTRRRVQRFDLLRLLRAVTGAQAELALDRGQVVELAVRGAYTPSNFMVNGNDSRLGQVFTNLIDNGRSFTADGGKVRVTAERFNNFIEVVVDDEGPGIKEEVLERIFERFYTDRSEQQSFGNNSGLGLAICRQIVDAHSGEIFAENRYRTTIAKRDVAGARFTVRLPAA